ncbi:MAG: hypothetical protein K2L14_01310 [Duncaniella sp.]|nr:hypothetical protein [Duncaniella sp.]
MKKLFTLLAAALLTVGSICADTVELTPGQRKANGKGSTTFKNGYEITNDNNGDSDTSKWKDTGSGNNDYDKKTSYLKYSSGVLYTIVIPEGRQVTAVTITGGTRSGENEKDSSKSWLTTYLKELNSVTYGSDEYVFVAGLDKKTGVEPTTYSFTFDVPVTGSFTFKHQGTESLFNFILTDEEEPAVGPSGLAWSDNEITYKIRDNVEAPTFQNPNDLPVTFTTNNEEIATVDENGVVTLKNYKVGTAKVRAIFAGNDTYEKETLELNIAVKTNEVLVPHNYDGVEPSHFILDKMLAASMDSYEAAEIFADENLHIYAHSKTISTKKYAGTYGGYTFTRGVQVRVANDPSEGSPYGPEYGDDIADETTSLVVIPEVDMTLYVYGRREVREDKSLRKTEDDVENNVITVNQYYMFQANDEMSLKFNEVDNPTEVLNKNSYLGKWDGIGFMYGISEIELEAGKEYNMYCVGTTYIVNGIGYNLANKEGNVVNTNSHVVEFTQKALSATDDFGFTLARTGETEISMGQKTEADSKISVNGTDHVAFKMKGLIKESLDQVTYTITAPANMTIKKATIYAFANSGANSEETYFTQVGNHTFAKGDLNAITSTDRTAPVVLTVDHVMLNKMDMNLHTEKDLDISVVVDVEYIHTEHVPGAPVLTVDGEEHNGEEYEFETESSVGLNPTASHHNIYFHFAAEEAQAAPAKVKLYAEGAAEAPVASMVHEGKTFTLMPEEGVTIDKAGTLSYFAHDPVNDLTSEVKTLKVKGNGVVTGIENVAVDAAAEVEYFNLQGIRVVNPENGVFIRRQGNEVKKVVL